MWPHYIHLPLYTHVERENATTVLMMAIMIAIMMAEMRAILMATMMVKI